MRHADQHLLHAAAARLLNQIAEQRDHALATLEREALLADIARVEIALDALGAREALENLATLGLLEPSACRGRLEAPLQPEPLLGIGDVAELGGDRAAVNALQPGPDLPERQPVRAAEPCRGENCVVVRGAKPVESGIELRQRLRTHQPQRIEFRQAVPTQAVGLDQAQHRRLLVQHRLRHCTGVCAARGMSARAANSRSTGPRGVSAPPLAMPSNHCRSAGSTEPGSSRYCS
jgi:hypothetical protein